MDTGKNELSEDYLLKLTLAALREGTIVTDPVDRIMCLEREVTRHVIHEHINESSTIYKNSDILRRKNNEH